MSKRSQGSQATGRGWTQWKASDARKALAEWRSSGLSAAAFVAQQGYSVARLRYWSERLDREPSAEGSTLSFVPVTLESAARTRHSEIERGGVVLRVREDLDVEHVARLVAALGSVTPAC